jgi:uncharacterized membrane protein YeaQ/YmgE (transglycosylase-associated protein family)
MPTLAQVIVWVIVGLIGGSLVGLLITWRRKGFGFFQNLGMGLIGGLFFRLFDFFPKPNEIAISLRDIVAACVVSLLVLVVLWAWGRFRHVS